jgi:hypothetical protein
MTTAVNAANREMQKNMENLAEKQTKEIEAIHKAIAEATNIKSDKHTTDELEKKLTVVEKQLAQAEEATKSLTAELKAVKNQ